MRVSAWLRQLALFATSLLVATALVAEEPQAGSDAPFELDLDFGLASDLDPALLKVAPDDLDDARAIEAAVLALSQKLLPCTVGVQVGNNHGSGVLIGENGLVLTAAHVADRPGRRATIRFSDGREADAKTLGMNLEADGALIQITDEGTWPFAPLVALEDYPRPGDWCVATGHPGGFTASRAPPIRLGRVIDVNRYVLRTDCAINSGDSGGPLFDMHGSVIGIHSRIAEGNTVNLHGPVLEFLESWKEMKAGKVYPAVPESKLLDRMDIDRNGKITRAEFKDQPYYERVYDRLIKQLDLETDKEYEIGELTERFGWRDVPINLAIRDYQPNGRPGQILPEDRFTRGDQVLEPFEPLVQRLGLSVVEVHSGGRKVALGTAVECGVLTKASELGEQVTCKTHDGREIPARVVHVHNGHDLALLELEGDPLPPVKWAPKAEMRVGSWLVTADADGLPLSVGVVSVGAREVQGNPPVLGIAIGEHSDGVLIESVSAGGGAAEAGLQPKDVIVGLMDKAVANVQELKSQLGKYRPGDFVRVAVLRGDERQEFSVRLRTFSDVFIDNERFGSGRLNGKLSNRRDSFPSAVQHDSVLTPEDCGGPVLDTLGRVVGINIARADRIGSYLLPHGVVAAVLDEFKQSAAE